MKKLKIYFAGKVSPESVFASPDWRDRFCEELSQKTGVGIINLDPTKTFGDFVLDHNDPRQVFGRNCFMIKFADLIVVNLTDDVSVGGSQEMLIAKYYKKSLVGIALQGGKFRKKEKTISGRIYRDWIDPYVSLPCDIVVDDLNGVADFVREFVSERGQVRKDLSVVDEAVEYYESKFHQHDIPSEEDVRFNDLNH